jgi:hypothetical protein
MFVFHYAILLALLFPFLKVAGLVTWPWIWVLSPAWISFFLFLVVGVILVFSIGSKF